MRRVAPVDEAVDVRLAHDAELPVLVAAFGQEHFFRDRLIRQSQGLGELFVAWAGSTPVGDVYLWREQADEAPVREHLPWTPMINHLEVHPSWQKRGIGTALVRATEEHAARMGYGQICLGVSVDNHDARRLYTRLGYSDWEHGLVDVVWDEPGPDGAPVHYELVCHWLVRALPTQGPGLDDWEAWTPEEAHRRLKDSTVDWHVAAGWAIDLYLGRQTREHEDLEVAIDRADFPAWRSYLESQGYDLYDAAAGRLRRLGPGDEPDPKFHQVWLCDPRDDPVVWRMDTFLEERDGGQWSCHWLPDVRVPMSDAIDRTADGVAYLRPELVLLGKAKHCRPKDDKDLRLVLPTLDEAALDRLRFGLAAADPAHAWLAHVPHARRG